MAGSSPILESVAVLGSCVPIIRSEAETSLDSVDGPAWPTKSASMVGAVMRRGSAEISPIAQLWVIAVHVANGVSRSMSRYASGSATAPCVTRRSTQIHSVSAQSGELAATSRRRLETYCAAVFLRCAPITTR